VKQQSQKDKQVTERYTGKQRYWHRSEAAESERQTGTGNREIQANKGIGTVAKQQSQKDKQVTERYRQTKVLAP
jgi:hypothetical protein